ncbi:hypothetical protein [Variovorax sp. 54]|uniref:hypothetical protein n=1 Tax=Variovorax sp. 54 TaxID=2035212 RepID=UPI0011815ED3|nr:hypothetical protein [Variovorax sp. 54]
MKKIAALAAVAGVAAAMFAPAGASAESAELRISGAIVPSACTLAFAGGGVVDYPCGNRHRQGQQPAVDAPDPAGWPVDVRTRLPVSNTAVSGGPSARDRVASAMVPGATLWRHG